LLPESFPVIESLGRIGSAEVAYEIIFVDDGSIDDTVDRLIELRDKEPAIKIVRLTRNFGKDIAVTAGLEHAAGAAVIPMDVDLQDPPEIIPEMYAKWIEGYELVNATRVDRSTDSLMKRITARWFYSIFNRLADTTIPRDTGDFRLLDRRVVDALSLLPERNRFLKGLFAWVGFRQTTITFVRPARSAGRSKWPAWRLWNFALDGITAFSTLPLRIWSYIGAILAGVGFLYAVFLILRTIVVGVDVPGYASLMVAVLFMGGINLMTLGIIGEYIGRIYTEAKQRPLYLVRERIGFPRNTKTGSEKA
jgi:glycosyltransferase involved in cell wall biosynthesis